MKIKYVQCLRWLLPIAIVVFAPRPAAAFTINWTNHSWQWFGNGPGSPNPLPDYNPVCMDGSDTGIGIYVPTNWNGKVLYWFDGGGYCWDNTSCNSNPAVTPASIASDFINGVVPLAPFVFRKSFAYSDFNNYVTQTGGFDLNLMVQQKPVLGQGIFDHTTGTTNPFANYLEVFVPYCTGDFHVGAKNDNQGSAFLRVNSNINFVGLSNSKNAVNYTNQNITAQLGHAPPLAVISGGSAGGFGAILMYASIRPLLSASTKMITIDDGGTIYATGVPNANGTAWNSQGFAGFPTYLLSTNKLRPGCNQYPNPFGPQCASPSQPTYQEAWMDDAWGTTFASAFPSAYVSPSTPAGSPASFYSMQSILDYEVHHVSNGDTFHLIDSNNDFVDTWFFSMYPNGQFPIGYTGSADVAHGQAQIISAFGTTLWQVTLNGSGVGTWAGAIPWSEHHGFILDDTSTWDSSVTGPGGGVGSGVKQFLNSIAPTGGW